MICCLKVSFFDHFNENFYTKLHGSLNVPLLFKSQYKAWNFLNDKLPPILLLCIDNLYHFGKFVGFWKCKSIIDTDFFYSNLLNNLLNNKFSQIILELFAIC